MQRVIHLKSSNIRKYQEFFSCTKAFSFKTCPVLAELLFHAKTDLENFQNVMWSLLNVCFPIATIFGQFLAAFLCRRIGRKGTALLASGLYIPGVLLCAATKYFRPFFELLYIGRILW